MSAQPPATASPSGSFKGWNWHVYLAKTKTGLKWIAGALVAYLFVVIGPVQPPELNNLLSAVLGYASKAGLDFIDYYFTENPS